MYKNARKKAGLSIEEAAYKLNVATRTLSNYECGQTVPPSEVVLAMSRVYGEPFVTQLYCKECCAIGKAYSYEVLNNVNLSLESVLISLQEELEEAIEVLPTLLKLVRNKRCKEDFNQEEWREVIRSLHEWLDLEHNIVCLKIAFNKFSDVSLFIQQHNSKCIQRNYVNKKRALC